MLLLETVQRRGLECWPSTAKPAPDLQGQTFILPQYKSTFSLSFVPFDSLLDIVY